MQVGSIDPESSTQAPVTPAETPTPNGVAQKTPNNPPEIPPAANLRQRVEGQFVASIKITRAGDPRSMDGRVFLVPAADEFGEEIGARILNSLADFDLDDGQYKIDTVTVAGSPQDFQVRAPEVISPDNPSVHVTLTSGKGVGGGTLRVLDALTRKHIAQVELRMEASKYGQGIVSKLDTPPYFKAHHFADNLLTADSPLWVPSVPNENRIWITAENYDWQTIESFHDGMDETVFLHPAGSIQIKVDPDFFDRDMQPEDAPDYLWVFAETAQGSMAKRFWIRPTTHLEKLAAGPVHLKVTHASPLGHGLSLFDSPIDLQANKTKTIQVHPDKPAHGLAPASLTVRLVSNRPSKLERQIRLRPASPESFLGLTLAPLKCQLRGPGWLPRPVPQHLPQPATRALHRGP